MMTPGISKVDREKHEKLLSGLKPGQSFFLPHVLPVKCGYIRRLGYKLGVKISIRYVEQDTIYGEPGSRVLRVD